MQSLTWLEITVGIFSIIATLIAGLSAYFSFCANRRSKRTEKKLADDESIVHGTPIHPELNNPIHEQCVIRCTLVNTSKHRRACVTDVRTFNRQGNLMEVTWCSAINRVGNPENPGQVIAIDDAEDLYIRDNHGEHIGYAKIEVFHSFPGSPAVITYDATRELFGDDMPD